MRAERTRGKANQPPDLSGHFLAITGRAPVPMAAVEGARHIVRHVNSAFCRLMDQPMTQLVGKPFSKILPEKDGCLPVLDRVFRTGKSETHTEQKHSKRSPVFWSYTMWPLVTEERSAGIIIQVSETVQQAHKLMVEMNESLLLGSLHQHELTAASENWNAQLQQEIAERKKAEQELSEKARLLDLSTDAIIVHDLDDKIKSWNKGAEQLYGWTAEEVIGKKLHSLLHTEFSKPINEMVGQLQSKGHFSGEFVQTTRDGRQVFSLCRKVLDRGTKSILTSYTDITVRKQHEETVRAAGELTRANAQLLLAAAARKRLEAKIASAIEGDRKRLGQELHDGLVQELTGIGMMLHVVAGKLKKTSPPLARETHRLCLMLETAHDNARNLAKRFYPVELQEHGLVVALQNFARGIQEESGISCVVQVGARSRLKSTAALHLFRIAQEAVHNAVRHAQAKEIRIHLGKEKGVWTLAVKDDGVGLRSGLQQTRGMGLRIMEYRAQLIQGTLSVCNGNGGGVLLSCTVPVCGHE